MTEPTLSLLDVFPSQFRVDWEHLYEQQEQKLIELYRDKDHWQDYKEKHNIAFHNPQDEETYRAGKIKNEGLRWRASHDGFFLGREILNFRDLSASLHRCLFDWMYCTRFSPMRAVSIGRGQFKSTCCSVVFSLQNLINDPSLRHAFVSGAKKLGEKSVGPQIQEIIETNRVLHKLFPDAFAVNTSEYRPWTTSQWSIKRPSGHWRRGHSFDVVSSETQDTGLRYDIGIFDDIVDEHNFRTQEGRKKILETYSFVRFKLDPMESKWTGVGRQINFTPYDSDDLYMKVILPELAGAQWDEMQEHMRAGEMFVTDSIFYVPPATHHGAKIFPAFPERFSLTDVEKLYEETALIDRDIANSQVRLYPVSSSDSIFPGPYTGRYWEPGQVPETLHRVLCVDLATDKITRSRTKDETVIQVAGYCFNRQLWDLDHIAADIMSNADLIENIVGLYFKWRPLCRLSISSVGMEYRFATQLFEEIDKRTNGEVAPISYKNDKYHTNKITHCSYISTWWRRKELWIDPDHPQLLAQIRNFTGRKKAPDDHVDVFSTCAMLLSDAGPPEKKAGDTRKQLSPEAERLARLNGPGFFERPPIGFSINADEYDPNEKRPLALWGNQRMIPFRRGF